MYRMNGVSQEESSKYLSSCVERAGTKNKVYAGSSKRIEEKDDLRTREGQ